jgi:hypothetical protein
MVGEVVDATGCVGMRWIRVAFMFVRSLSHFSPRRFGD